MIPSEIILASGYILLFISIVCLTFTRSYLITGKVFSPIHSEQYERP